jgi:WD40 repeat protein
MLAITNSECIGLFKITQANEKAEIEHFSTLMDSEESAGQPTAVDWIFPSSKLVTADALANKVHIWDVKNSQKILTFKSKPIEDYNCSQHQPNL